MATTAQYTVQPIIESFSAVNQTDVSRSAPTTSLALSAGPAVSPANGVGKRINKVTVTEVNAAGAGVANVIRFWLEPAGSNTKYLLVEKAVPQITSSSTAIGYRIEIPELVGMILPGATSDVATLHFSAHLNASYHITIESGLL